MDDPIVFGLISFIVCMWCVFVKELCRWHDWWSVK